MKNRDPCSASSIMPPCSSKQCLPISSPLHHPQSSWVGQLPMQRGDQGPHWLHPCMTWDSFGSIQSWLQRSVPSCSLGRWDLWDEHCVAKKVTGHPLIVMHLVVCPKMPQQSWMQNSMHALLHRLPHCVPCLM